MKKNKALIGAISAVSAGCVGAYLIGNYFVEYGLKRKEKGYEDPLSPSYEYSGVEKENRAIAKTKIAKLYENVCCEEIHITTEDNENLYAKIFKQQQESNLWVVIVHGYTVTSDDIQDVTYEYYQRGYNVITPDLRAHGNSTGEYITLGEKDGQDLVEWTNYINENYEHANIVLHGFSMGAATVMLAAGHKCLPENVFAIIEDSGYTTAQQMLKEQVVYRFNLPSFPMVLFASIVAKLKVNVDLYEPKPIKALQNATVPILFIHGDEDIFVLPYMQVELYNSYDGPKDIYIIEGAGHIAGRFIEPETYYNRVFEFLGSV